MVKERVVNSKCKLLYFGICLSLFGVFIRPILERAYQSCNIYNASLFLFCSFESINLFIFLSIYLSIYLSTSNLPANLSIQSYLSKFSKSGFISRNSTIYQNRLSSNSDSNKGQLYWVVQICAVIKNCWVRLTKFTICPYLLNGHCKWSVINNFIIWKILKWQTATWD